MNPQGTVTSSLFRHRQRGLQDPTGRSSSLACPRWLGSWPSLGTGVRTMPASAHHLHTHCCPSPFFLPHPQTEHLEVREVKGGCPCPLKPPALWNITTLLSPQQSRPTPLRTRRPRPREGNSLLKDTLLAEGGAQSRLCLSCALIYKYQVCKAGFCPPPVPHRSCPSSLPQVFRAPSIAKHCFLIWSILKGWHQGARCP